MPPGLHCLHNVDLGQDTALRNRLVDIVAVHDVHDDSIEGWTEPETGINWLRDLLPQDIRVARVLTYGYDASVSAFFGDSAALNIQRMAECLVQELYADRRFAGMKQRPIIFVCHGLGGVLVKRSLIYSSTRTAAKVEHLWDQFVSTFAILFFGTPHGRTAKSNWLALDKASNFAHKVDHDDHPQYTAEEDSQIFRSISGEFSPLMKQFHMFFFVEELPTSFGDHSDFIVDWSSAVPDLDNVEKMYIKATHSGMVKFGLRESSIYPTVKEALSRYCMAAPRIISHRWRLAIPALDQLRAGEAYELGGLGFDIIVQRMPHRHFYPPQEATPDFIGREGMFEILYDTFFPGGCPNVSPRRKSFVVFGMGGSGKTQFCSKFAHEHRDQYVAIYTIHAASAETIKDSFSEIGKLGDMEPTENAGRHSLSQLSEPWLLIIDNADDPSLDLRSLFPLGDTAHILVTTRNPDFRQQGSLGSMELKGLKEEEALQLLLTKADIPRPWDASTRNAGIMIAKTLGYLALALIHAGNCIYRRVCNLSDYLNLHSASRNVFQYKRASATYRDEESDMVKAVYSTFDISLEFLLKRQTVKSQDASELLKIICFYHFERIPVEIFTRAVINRRRVTDNAPCGSFASRLLKAIVKRLEPPKMLPRFLKDDHHQLDHYRVKWAVSELQSLSLISYEGRDSSFSLHPLVHAWARDSLSISERKTWASIALNTLLESILLPPEGSSETDGDFHRDIIPHLDAALLEHGTPISTSIAALGEIQMKMAKIFQPTLMLILRDQVLNAAKCGYVFANRGQFIKATVHLQTVKNSLTQVLGNENEKTMTAMLGLAGVYWGLGRLEEAITLQGSVVETRTRIYGPQHEQTLQAMNQLGRSYWLNGQYHEALALQNLTTQRMKAAMGQTHPHILEALDNLGVTLGAWHRYEESMQAHRQVLAVRTKSLGETHLDTLTTMSNLAMALLDLGRLDEANSLMRRVYQQRQKQLGKEHPWTLLALCYLAKIYIEMGSLQEAEELLTWGIAAGERSLSKDHLGVLMGRGELARVYARQGRLKEAETLTLSTMESIEFSRGIAHPDCVYGLWKLAQLYELLDDEEQAIRTCQLALERADMRITRAHPLGKKIQELLRKLQSGSSHDPEMTTRDIGGQESQHIRHFGVRHQQTW
ncbi:hypothetical protein K469DRAFT_742537 [Zopfia rhizophila CBS 207.26]|uniref:TPR-like protein n=1 Tax=Zopfia rhizophila CBS 207.26 TaxID=1314779 RepID=A0A6A6DER2_9PEZI|nr:hypothetical protein K469DRAFT_742537 [Zopfia rhizophila CBS 207.26]